MAVSVNKNLAASYILEDPLGRIANDGRIANLGRVGLKGYNDARWAYNFDSVDDYGVLATRAINPDGDNAIEFFSVETANTTILAQNISATIGAREFQIWQGDLMELNLTFGGSTTNLCTVAQGYISGRKYFLTLTGTSFTLARDNAENVIRSATFTKGAAREPAAQTLIMCRSAGAGSFASFSRGLQYNIRINGVLWAMDQRNQTIQPSTPAGNNMTLVNTTSDRWIEVPQ